MDICITNNTENVTQKVMLALRKASKEKNIRIIFEKGTYDFFPEYAEERSSCISNHDNDGYKKIGFLIENAENVTIDGNGSLFMFHGVMLPFQIIKSKNVTLKNFAINFPVTLLAHGTVIEAGSNFCDLKLWDNTPYVIDNERLCFLIDGGYKAPYWGALEFDAEKECIAYRTNDRDYFSSGKGEELSKGIVRLNQEFPIIPQKGNTFVIHFGQRLAPGIFIDESSDVKIDNVTIHHSLGMGILAQNSSDIDIIGLKITPSENRYASCYADGVHFVNCFGEISLDKCLIEKQMDDPLNCHGIYARIDTVIDSKTILLRLMQNQQLGVKILEKGSNVAFIRQSDLSDIGTGKIENVSFISRELMIVSLKDDISKTVKCGDCIENLDRTANLTVKNSYFGKNRARGLLITTRGKVLVENNVFEKMGAAIRISGDANFWFESGCVRDVTIRNNTFINTNANERWGKSAIDIAPQIISNNDNRYYHKNILIENNTFRLFNKAAVWAQSVENLTIRNNVYEKSYDFEPYGDIDKHVSTIECKNVVVENFSEK